MIPAELEEQILRLHFVEKWPVGTIARHVAVHHSTVRRVLKQAGLSERQPVSRPSKVDPFLPFIHQTLAAHPKLPASRLHAMCAERGYAGSAGHFRRIVARLRPRKPAEAFQRLRTLPGEEAQVDWGHFGRHPVGRATRPLNAFVMVLSWSRMPFVQFFWDQRMTSFLAGHATAFEFFGGVPRRCLYDNLKSVVTRRHGQAIQFNPTAMQLAAHYRFEPRPVAVYRGNEKGRVERMIRFMRTSFWPALRWSDLADLNAKALSWCTQIAGARLCPEDRTQTVLEAWQSECARLLPLQGVPFPHEERIPVSIGKTPYARFEGNDYSVPHTQVRRRLTLLVSPESVRIESAGEVIASHPRSFDSGAQIEVPEHLEALVKFKREAREGRAMDRLHHAVPASRRLLEEAAAIGHNLGSAVAGLQRLLDNYGAEALGIAVQAALEAERYHVAAVKQLLEQRREAQGRPPALPITLCEETLTQPDIVPHSLADYDTGGGR